MRKKGKDRKGENIVYMNAIPLQDKWHLPSRASCIAQLQRPVRSPIRCRVVEVTGLMLASLLCRNFSPKRATSERAIEELVTVIQSIFPVASFAAISGSGWSTSLLV